jgi:acetyl esterase/lipase
MDEWKRNSEKMKRVVLIIGFCSIISKATSQILSGITGKKDSSYTTRSAYSSDKKNFPDIKIVEEFQFSSVEEKRGIEYCELLDKRKLLIDAFYPKNKKNKKKNRNKKERTAILIIHGGGWRSGDRSQHYPLAQRLAALGYVCFTPEYRLSTEAFYPAAVYDIKSALRWVKKNAGDYNIDTNKVTVLGFSAGGELAAFMGTTNGNSRFEGNGCHLEYSSRVQAVVDIDGILSFIHPESGEGDDSKKISAATYWFGYSKQENPLMWKEASPLTHAGKNTPPTLFVNSSVDRMHAGRDDYIKILSGFDIYTEVKSFDKSPHSFCLYEPWFAPTVKYIDEFLRKVFPG